MRITFMGSGAFGLPTIERLADEHEIALVVSQPARPAGRRRSVTPTPIAAWAEARGLDTFTPERLDSAARSRIAAAEADAQVVIAYGHKIPASLTEAAFSINLHASLLPRWRGAAPINHAMVAGDAETGVSVISLARKMDAGLVYGVARTAIDPFETAGELHDRLALLGPDLVANVLDAHRRGAAEGTSQDPDAVTAAPKLSRADAVLDFTRPAADVRARIHGFTPWPGCSVQIGDHALKLTRVRDVPDRESVEGGADVRAGDATNAGHAGHARVDTRGRPDTADAADTCDTAGPRGTPGTLDADGCIVCGAGRLELVEVCPPGKRAMSFDDFRRGQHLEAGAAVASPAIRG
ncbi:MAG: methionyl-tRNA formyltransferase [Phycisphaerales bacterium]